MWTPIVCSCLTGEFWRAVLFRMSRKSCRRWRWGLTRALQSVGLRLHVPARRSINTLWEGVTAAGEPPPQARSRTSMEPTIEKTCTVFPTANYGGVNLSGVHSLGALPFRPKNPPCECGYGLKYKHATERLRLIKPHGDEVRP